MKYGNTLIRKIYYSSPYFVRNLFTTSYGYLHSKKAYGKYYNDYLDFLLNSQYWSNERIKEYQWEMTKNFIKHSYDNTIFYHRIFKQLHFTPDDIKKPTDLLKLPIIDKSIVRKNKSDIIPRNLNSKKIIWKHTSGTTGTSLVFPMTIEAYQKEYSIRELQYHWSGLSVNNHFKKAIIAGHPVANINRTEPPFWSYDFLNNELYFSSYHLSDRNIISYIKKLGYFSPSLILGYPSSIYLIARKIQDIGIQGCIHPKAVVTSSETLLSYQKHTIEDVFRCPIYNYYGNAEGCGKILTCPEGNHHLLLQDSYTEILGDNIICTNFTNYSFPLIRYKINDRVKLSSNQSCECGRNGILIEEIEGRVEDYILLPDGRQIGRLDHIFKDSVNIIEAQIFQDNINNIVLRIVKTNDYNKDDEMMILKEARNRLGNQIKISLEYLDEIPRTNNGKFRFVISELKDSQPGNI